MTELSQDAVDMLLHAHAHTGCAVGNGDAADELRAAGLITDRDNLTAKGAQQAKALQAAQWPATAVEAKLASGPGWEPPAEIGEQISQDAVDSLLHAHRGTGGQPGIASQETLAEMRAAGLLSPRNNLTAKGAAWARTLQDDRWPDPHF